MRNPLRSIAIMSLGLAVSTLCWSQETQPAKPYVVVFDFASIGSSDAGKQLADSVRLRLARHEEFEVIDGLSTSQASGPVADDTDESAVVSLMKNHVGAQIAIFGTVARGADKTTSADIRCIDLRQGPRVLWARTFRDATERARGEIARGIVETLRNEKEWTPPQYGDESEPPADKLVQPLNTNGSFDDKWTGWEHPDNVSTFIVPQDGRGGVLKINTALTRDPWLEYRRALRFGQADPDHPPVIQRDTSYGCVGGLEGVHYKSDWIVAKPGMRYWLLADCKGADSAKIFVKGFRDTSGQEDSISEGALIDLGLTAEKFAQMPPAQQKTLIAQDAKKNPARYRRECYRWYLACEDSRGQWKHFAAPFPPRGGLPADVQWLQIQVYAYWPAGEYFFDNVKLYADPAQRVPLAEEKPRTPKQALERAATSQAAKQ